MNILLLGKQGQVGWELQRALLPLGTVTAFDQTEVDFIELDKLGDCILKLSPDIVVNAAAYTAVDKAESEPELANIVNAQAVKVIAEAVKQINGCLVHYSTDYVFDGTKDSPYLESDATSPQSVYGQTKQLGEQLIADVACQHFIFRTSWVYARLGHNFARTMLRLAKQREQLKVVVDQVGVPTSAELIADITAMCLLQFKQGNNASGLYHLVASGETNWHEFAKLVITEAIQAGAELKISPEQIIPIKTSAYPTPATRPLNSRLNTDKIKQQFGLVLPDWQVQVKRLVAELALQGQL